MRELVVHLGGEPVVDLTGDSNDRGHLVNVLDGRLPNKLESRVGRARELHPCLRICDRACEAGRATVADGSIRPKVFKRDLIQNREGGRLGRR